jgi:HSP20 family protein
MTALDIFRQNRNPARFGSLLRDYDDFFRDFDRMLEPFINQPVNRSWQVPYDVRDKDDQYQMSFDLPGIKRDDINIEVQGQRLLVSGERKAEDQGEDGQYLTRKQYGSFQHVFNLPENVDTDSIQANYEDGVLYLTLPKSENAKNRKIKIGEGKGTFLKKVMGKTGHSEQAAEV